MTEGMRALRAAEQIAGAGFRFMRASLRAVHETEQAVQANEAAIDRSGRQVFAGCDWTKPARAFLWDQSRALHGGGGTSLRAAGQSLLAGALPIGIHRPLDFAFR